MKTKTHTFHRENCNTIFRAAIIDMIGRRIILTGTHAFEWWITIIDRNSVTSIRFINRVEAKKEFNKYLIKKR